MMAPEITHDLGIIPVTSYRVWTEVQQRAVYCGDPDAEPPQEIGVVTVYAETRCEARLRGWPTTEVCRLLGVAQGAIRLTFALGPRPEFHSAPMTGFFTLFIDNEEVLLQGSLLDMAAASVGDGDDGSA